MKYRKKNRTLAPDATDVDSAEHGWTRKQLDILKWVLVLVILASGAFIGSFVVYQTGARFQKRLFQSEFDGYVRLFEDIITLRFQQLTSAVATTEELFDNRRPWNATFNGVNVPGLPYYTYFQASKGLRTGNPFMRVLAWCPLITNTTYRAFVESFLNQTSTIASFDVSPISQSILKTQLAQGITARDASSAIVPLPDSILATRPMFPIVYAAPLEDPTGSSIGVIGYDLISEPERALAIRRCIQYDMPVSTGLVSLIISDIDVGRAAFSSSVLYKPSYDRQNGTDHGVQNGITTLAFTWYRLLSTIVPSTAAGINVVLSTPSYNNVTKTASFLVRQGVTREIGQRPIFEEAMEPYHRVVHIAQGPQIYTFEIYPTSELRNQIVNNEPRDGCIIVLAFTVVTAAIFVVYDIIATKARRNIRSIAQGAFRVLDDILPHQLNRRVVGENIMDYEGSRRMGQTGTSSVTTQPPTKNGGFLGAFRANTQRRSTSVSAAAGELGKPQNGHGSAYDTSPGSDNGGENAGDVRLSVHPSKSSRGRGSAYDDISEGSEMSGDGSEGTEAVGASPPSVRRLKPTNPRMNMISSSNGGGGEDAQGLFSRPALEQEHGAGVIADYHPDVSVLFMDIVSFTSWSQEQSPTRVLTVLDILFGEIDKLTDAYNVYKIDTIGDAYLAVTGCPRSSPAHATDMANFALAMMGIMGRVRQKTGYSNLQIRVGIHSGPLTAGILRSAKRLKYSIYGDTVNMASRIESSGEPMRIHMSDTFAGKLLLGDGYLITERGMVELKGKGSCRTFWLNGSASGSDLEGTTRRSREREMSIDHTKLARNKSLPHS